ncbi:MAG: hypothetical protein Q8R37_04190 [Nanoarchaeota archaeon]|nr:hypothetical protein [Nanoarchaeota archaeon]
MKNEFKKVRQDLEEHLAAINENTLEIQALLDYIQEIEVKVDKLGQRLEQFELSQGTAEKPSVSPLNQSEKKVFLVLYTESEALTFKEIALKASIAPALIPETISSLVQKGIPLRRSYFDNHLFFKLDPQFKELQAKENIINLSLQSFME